MPFSTDVNLPKNYQPRFPDRCVVCNEFSPESTIRLMTTSVGWWSFLFGFLGKPFSVKAPSCRLCKWKLHGLRVGSWVFTIIVAVLVSFYGWPFLAEFFSPILRKWIVMAAFLVALSPLLLYEAYFPHPFCITAYSDNVDYEFNDEKYAMDFASMNLDAEWVTVDSVDLRDIMCPDGTDGNYKNKSLVEYHSSRMENFLKTPFDKLSFQEMVFVAVWELEAEVNSGGFDQYYRNSSGNTAYFVEEALKEISAEETCKIVRQANSIFPDGFPPADHALRIDLLDEGGEATEDFLDTLDNDFFDYPNDLTDLMFQYMTKNASFFPNWTKIIERFAPSEVD